MQRSAAANDGGIAAISSALAKEVYNLEAVASNIEDRSNNITRFLVIGKMLTKPSGDDKTSLVFSVQRQAGRAAPNASALRQEPDQFVQDRIAADQEQALGVPVFFRSAGARRTGCR